MRRRAFLALAIALLSGGCHFGRNTRQVELAREPRGAEVRVSTATRDFEGELLAVGEAGLTIVQARRVMLVPFDRLQSLRSYELQVEVRRGFRLNRHQREQLRLHARYPQGIDETLLQLLLAAYGQNELTVVN